MLLNRLQVRQYPFISNGVISRYPFANSPLQRPRSLSLQAVHALPSKTQRIMKSIPVNGEVGGTGGAYSYNALQRLDQLWSCICSAQTVVKECQRVFSSFPDLFSQSDLAGKEVDTFDVLVCGGTLGIFIATALISKGLRVGIVEKNLLNGVYCSENM